MKNLKIYEYAGCSTCKKALNWLESKKISFEKIAIVDQPPTLAELRQMLADVGDVKKLFNTSGQLYREFRISDKLPGMSSDDALKLLAKHGKLIKRPFVLGGTKGLVGFKEDEWKKQLK